MLTLKIAYVLYLLQAELRHLTSLRHAYLTSKAHTKHAQSRTVLITGIPKTLLTEKDMRQFASFVPGGIARVWIYRASKVTSFGIPRHRRQVMLNASFRMAGTFRALRRPARSLPKT